MLADNWDICFGNSIYGGAGFNGWDNLLLNEMIKGGIMIQGNGINVNTSANVKAVEASKHAIMEILNAKADQETIRKGLDCLMASCTSGTAYVSNCVVSGSEEESKKDVSDVIEEEKKEE